MLAAAGALCSAASALAQSVPHEDGAEEGIVVTGRKDEPTRGEIFRQAEKLSRVSRFNLAEEALPRFETPLCPGIFGLKAEIAEMMVDRIRTNAVRLGVPLAAAQCSPNLVVGFVDDGRSFLGRLETARPGLFSLVGAAERGELLTGEGPVRVWSNIETRLIRNGQLAPRRNGKEQIPSPRGQLNRLALPARRDIVSVLVLFDRSVVDGMTLIQLADYATMRGLSHTRPASGNETMATILALFETGGEANAELTGFDIGYLRSLYSSAPNLSAATRFVGVRRQTREGMAESVKP